MATVIDSLFGITPESLMAQREQALQQRAIQYAQLDPMQQAQAGFYTAGSRLGTGISGLLGAEDPELKAARTFQEIQKTTDLTSPEGFLEAGRKLTSAGLGKYALPFIQQAQELKAKTLQNQKLEFGIAQEEALRKGLSELGPEATEEDILKVVTKYAPADKVLAVTQSALTSRANRDQRMAEAQARLDAQIQMAKDRNATQQQIAAMQIEGRKDLAALAASLKQAQPKVLPASLQKTEDEDLARVDSFTMQREALGPSIQALTPDPQTGKTALELSPGKIAGYSYQLAIGKSTPESRAYERLKSAVDTAVNLQVSAEKGVQTDADVLRFAKALIASYGRNDTKATLEALTRFNESIQKAEDKTKQRINSRRTSQGVEPYYIAGQNINVPAAPTKETPSALKPTHRFNPATGRVEAL